ncbi:hypothetical protein [Pedobacter sp. MR2016-19]|nr:hypothetical protein [Pedobacter sp. MR2016-19]
MKGVMVGMQIRENNAKLIVLAYNIANNVLLKIMPAVLNELI